jgi:hypothetical protein
MRDRSYFRAALLILAGSVLLAAPGMATVSVAAVKAAALQRVADQYDKTGCMVHLRPGHNCTAAPRIGWFATITERCSARLSSVAASAEKLHNGCAAVNEFVCFGASTCANRTLMDDNTTLRFGYDYVTWKVALVADEGVAYVDVVAPSAALVARTNVVSGTTVNGVSTGVFAEGLLLNYTTDTGLQARTTRMGFRFNTTRGSVVRTHHITNTMATEAGCLAHMDTDMTMYSHRLMIDNTKLCGSFVKHAIHLELGKFDAAVVPAPGACVANKKEAAALQKCLEDPDEPLLSDLPAKTAKTGTGYCTDRGLHDRARCMPKCACEGGSAYAAHLAQFTLLGNTLFPGREPCFHNTTTYDSMCGENYKAPGSGGMAAGIVALVVILVLGAVGLAGFLVYRNYFMPPPASGLEEFPEETPLTMSGRDNTQSTANTHHHHHHQFHESPHGYHPRAGHHDHYAQPSYHPSQYHG